MVAGLVPKIESAMMYSNNVVVFMDLSVCIKGVLFVIVKLWLSPNLFLDRPSPKLLPLSCTVGMLLLLTVAAVSLPSPSQSINHNKCSRIVCIDILTWYSEFNLLINWLCVLCLLFSHSHFTSSCVLYCLYEQSSLHTFHFVLLLSAGEIEAWIAYTHVWFEFAW